MLQKILSHNTCKSCKICCNYSLDSLWDIPGFTTNEYENVIVKYPEIINKSYYKNKLHYFETIEINNNKYLCPFLKSSGCALDKDKPFKCAIWPFYVVRHEENIYLAISSVCPNIREITPDILQNELSTFIQIIQQTIKKYPELIETNRTHFTLLMQLNI